MNTDSNTDDFLNSYIHQVKTKLERAPIRPDSTADASLVHNDDEAPKNRKRFYTNKQMDEIAAEECAECEYTWRKCSINPPSVYDRFFGCRKLRAEYYDCIEAMKKTLKEKSGKEPLIKN
ncbi:hypothetical protein FBU59_003972 [Linderina macrospora]|uniref:Uncharacterized protein n=1 Tax=Linderina macrospora TaxID=4868 RepID=A0ACC1J6V3_9FUNG|nr:hypothetical protein FBU59_003972 [Linderina macrospora]